MSKGKNRRVTIEDWVRIQRGVEEGRNVSTITCDIGVNASTVPYELESNRTKMFRDNPSWNPCSRKGSCDAVNVCGGCEFARCGACHRVRCWEVYEDYEERTSDIVKRVPFAGLER